MTTTDPFQVYSVSCFYHFTDRNNLELVRNLGGLYSFAELSRKGVKIPFPGGNDWSHDADASRGLDRYIHLCFRPNHPMEHVAHQEGRIQNPVYLTIHPDVLNWNGVMFTNDVSNKSGVELHSIDKARELIDFEVLYTRTNWSDPDIQQRLQQAEKYEILIPDHIPIDYIRIP